MSAENIETVREIYESWGDGDFRATLDRVDPNVVFVLRPGFPDSGVYLGIARIVEHTQGFLEAWSHITIEAEELAEVGDSVVARVRQRGVGVGSGADTDLRYFQLWTFRGGRVIRLENVRERADALEAVGLSG